jgi:hypothetical protein
MRKIFFWGGRGGWLFADGESWDEEEEGKKGMRGSAELSYINFFRRFY